MAVAEHRRRGTARRPWAPLVALALCCTLGVGASTGRANQPRAASPTPTVFALLADNRLLMVRLATGAVMARLRLGPPPVAAALAGYYLALSNDGRTVFALVPDAQRDRLCVIDPALVRVEVCHRLPAGLLFHSLAVGPKTGRLYLFGDRAAGRERSGPAPSYGNGRRAPPLATTGIPTAV